jgi:hypothetical protein
VNDDSKHLKAQVNREDGKVNMKVLITATVLSVLWCLFVHPDVYPSIGTYGVSVGIDTAYCSADFVHGQLMTSCQNGD